ncbi:pilus assembly protein [Sphingomonas sp.]|uniref:TadE/TadG family type IV pilus assembly protein n=1 Tax=Sphingomonas sp. TaxID=28214 RepID=UPI00286B87F9|nr:pilus assembly protein [Sphingomonas sp.]
MTKLRARVWSDRRGAAAAEMALVTPLLVILMFGSLEIGKFFWDENVVVKAARDGARYASRQSFASMPCGGPATNENQIKNVVRFGKPVVTVADLPLLYYWTNPATITVTIDCYANAGVNGARVYDGLYTARATVPRVFVTASVPYSPLVGAIGFQSTGLSLNATSQATVFGL